MADASTVGDRHGGHDKGLIAGLLDRDPSAPERAIARARVVTCPECAALYADLMALTRATTELPPATRTRDFRLTPADAARLNAGRLKAAVPGEPGGANARHRGEMTVLPAEHATHDTLLIASLLDRSPDAPDRDRAEALVAGCDDCAALHRDLVALLAATRSLPTPPRPRDFSLSADHVARLRPNGWRRLISIFGSSRDAFSRPLAVGLTTIGLAGLLVATVPGALVGQGPNAPALSSTGKSIDAGGPNRDVLGAALTAAPSEAPPAGQFAPSAGPSAAPAPEVPGAEALPQASADVSAAGPVASKGAAAIVLGSGTSEPLAASPATDSATVPAEPGRGPSALVIVAGLLLIVGLGLFALRWAARRRGAA